MDKLAQIDIGKEYGSPFGVTSTVGDLVSLILRGSFVVAGLIVLFFFIIGGLMVIQGAGNDNPQQAAQGKQALTGAVAGFAIVFVAYWIVRLIELITGSTFITSPNIPGL